MARTEGRYDAMCEVCAGCGLHMKHTSPMMMVDGWRCCKLDIGGQPLALFT